MDERISGLGAGENGGTGSLANQKERVIVAIVAKNEERQQIRLLTSL